MPTMDYRKKNLVIYITAGYPDMETTSRLILALQETGIGAIELGVPYTDPVADGPVIAQASLKSLEKGTNLDGIFAMAAGLKGKLKVPLYLMSYFSPVYSYGEDKYIEKCLSSGISGSILPDLSLDEGREFFRKQKKAGLDPILLAFPNTTAERAKEIAQETGSFIYFVNLFGTTGARAEIPQKSLDQLTVVRKASGKPVFAGFGVSNRESYQKLCALTEGVIIGSAVVKLLMEHHDDPERILKEAVSFTGGVLS